MNRSGRYRFMLAGTADEPEIRNLVGRLAMPGTVSIRFAREPDYFLGATVQGDPCDVLIARHEPDGQLAAVMVRGERRVYLDGLPQRIVYIGGIRVDPRHQGRWLMQRAALEVARLHEREARYFGVIAADNPVALGTIAGRRPPGGPEVRRVARLRSLAFVLHRRGRRRPGLPLEPATAATLDELVAFLHAHGPRRQLFPVVEAAHLRDGRTLRGLRLDDLVLVRRDGAIAGLLGAWDQSGYKQELVAAYGSRLARLRPAYDLAAMTLGASRLPRRGEPVRTSFGALRCLADDDPDVLAALLRGACGRASEQGQAFLMLGFDERDPQLQRLPRRLAVTYHSDVFLASFEGDPARDLDGRPVHVEVGTL